MSVAGTYAEALHQAAVQDDKVAEVSADLVALTEALDPGTEVGRVLHNPQVESRAKKAAIAGLTGNVNPLTVNLLQVLIDRGRLEDLPEIGAAFAQRDADAEGRISVEVTSAIALPDDLRHQVAVRIQEQTGKTPEITERVDPEIIGGLVLRVGGVVTDASVRGRLDGLRRSLTHVPA